MSTLLNWKSIFPEASSQLLISPCWQWYMRVGYFNVGRLSDGLVMDGWMDGRGDDDDDLLHIDISSDHHQSTLTTNH